MKNAKNPLRTAVALATSLLVPQVVSASDLQLEEIVVTAERRAEDLQSVPVSVTAFSSAEIQSAGIQDTQDFINLTPNLNLDDSYSVGNTFVTARGVAQINNSDSPVAVVVDGVPQNSQKQFKMEMFDVERIEVLRGPQGALYGRNAIGGAINIVTKQASDNFEGSASVGAGNGGIYTGKLALGGPVIEDKLHFRLAGAYKTYDGLIENDTLNKEVDYYDAKDWRGRLVWSVTETFTADFRYSYSDLDGGGLIDSSVGPGPELNADNYIDPVSNIEGKSDRTVNDASIKLDWNATFADVSYIFGATSLEESILGDSDFLAESLIPNPPGAPPGGLSDLEQRHDLEVDLYSHELRFTSPADRSFRWIVGGFYQTTERTLDSVLIATPVPPGGDLRVPLFTIFDEQDNDAWAVFAQAEYDIGDSLEVMASLRYDTDKREQTSSGLKEDFDSWQPKITVTKTLMNENTLYFTYSTGFRSGGFNGDGIVFEDETLENYELGFKSRFYDNRLQLNGAVFYSISEDFQYFYVDFSRGGQVIDNIDEVTLMGGELEVQYLASENLRLFGSLGITDSEIEDFSQFPEMEGNHSPKSSDPGVNLGFEYTSYLFDNIEAALRVDYEHRGEKYWHPDNLESQESLDILNARVSIGSDQWTFAIWGKNLTDEEYFTDYNDNLWSGLPTGQDIGYLGQPRTYGVEFTYNF